MSRPTAGLLAHTVTGDGDSRVLLLHGLGADRRQPLDLIDRDPGLRFIAPDLRAHGTTDLPITARDLTFDQMAADVEDLLESLDGDRTPVHVVGISMGAAIALQLLHRGNLDVRTALLVRPAWRWTPNPPNLAVFQDVATLLTTTEPEEARLRLQDGQRYVAIKQVSQPAAVSLRAQFDDPGAAQRVTRLTAIPKSAPRAPRQLIPGAALHVVGCPRDPIHPIPLAASLAGDLGAELHVVAPRYDQPREHHAEVSEIFSEMIGQT